MLPPASPGFLPFRKDLLLYSQRNELLEMLGFGIPAACLPLAHCTPENPGCKN